jgi:RHS repeat-associated protein
LAGAPHLNTPRLVEDQNQSPVWTWQQGEPFGDSVPNQQPASAGAFVFNLGLPGQYRDVETGTSYNYFRNYNPATGGYIESDPIGLNGGFAVYAYVSSSPLRWSDPFGLDPNDQYPTIAGAAKNASSYSRANCKDGFECGGWIFPRNNGFTYNFIQAKKTPWKVTKEEMAACKPEHPVAAWHKHPWYRNLGPASPDLPLNDFSGDEGDKGWATGQGLPLYLFAPSGADKLYTPGPGGGVSTVK